ncbi:MAG TPA: hypothetical protein VND22_07850, partial [Actinomycetota bacterium]|nr:hypothetical protein [Actinomycetota bacterium]
AGYEIDPRYVEASLMRVAEERKRLSEGRQGRISFLRVVLPAVRPDEKEEANFQARAVREGRKAKDIARAVMLDCGFDDIVEDYRLKNGVEVNFIANDKKGQRWYFDVSGAFSSTRAGLRRTDTIWKALGKAALMNLSSQKPIRLILLTTDLPPKDSAGFKAIATARGQVYFDAIEMLSDLGQARLAEYAKGGASKPIGELLPPATPD